MITTLGGSAMQTLHTPLDARLPRAVSVDVDLSGVTSGHRVLVVALVGSLADDPVTPPVGAPATIADLVQAWPHAALPRGAGDDAYLTNVAAVPFRERR